MCQEVPEGAPDCLAGLTFVISGTLDRYFILHFTHISHIFLDLHEAELGLQFIASSSPIPLFSTFFFPFLFALSV